MIFIDQARIVVKAGNGGKGCESYYKLKYMRYKRPDGGDGGRGGDIVFYADKGAQTLLDYKLKQHYKADDGGHASSKGKTGKCGKPCRLRVPLGTLVKDEETGLLIKDLVADQQEVIVAKGARGGLGNRNKRGPTLPKIGEERRIALELKLLADVGLVGFPNAGKSTLISNITNVESKIANYPFTTKQPILGIISQYGANIVMADLPGIIEDAHKGKGLGDRFLKHAERTKVVLHVVDMASIEGRNPIEDYKKIVNELELYNNEFLLKPCVIAANKMDLPEAEENLKKFKKKFKDKIIVPISAVEKTGFEQLISVLKEILCKENSQDK